MRIRNKAHQLGRSFNTSKEDQRVELNSAAPWQMDLLWIRTAQD
jgi:hypothetical protein